MKVSYFSKDFEIFVKHEILLWLLMNKQIRKDMLQPEIELITKAG